MPSGLKSAEYTGCTIIFIVSMLEGAIAHIAGEIHRRCSLESVADTRADIIPRLRWTISLPSGREGFKWLLYRSLRCYCRICAEGFWWCGLPPSLARGRAFIPRENMGYIYYDRSSGSDSRWMGLRVKASFHFRVRMRLKRRSESTPTTGSQGYCSHSTGTQSGSGGRCLCNGVPRRG
jgi:hypothetical protein